MAVSYTHLMDESYTQTALDNEIMELVSQFSDDEKRKLIDTIKLWSCLLYTSPESGVFEVAMEITDERDIDEFLDRYDLSVVMISKM